MASKLMPGLITVLVLLETSMGKSLFLKSLYSITRGTSAVAGITSTGIYAYVVIDPFTQRDVTLPEEYQEMEEILLELDFGYDKHEKFSKILNDDELFIVYTCNIFSVLFCILGLIFKVLKTKRLRNQRKKNKTGEGTESADTTSTTVA